MWTPTKLSSQGLGHLGQEEPHYDKEAFTQHCDRPDRFPSGTPIKADEPASRFQEPKGKALAMGSSEGKHPEYRVRGRKSPSVSLGGHGMR